MCRWNCCTGLFSTNSGICSSLVLIGVYDADEHGIPGVNAGHWQNTNLHSLHTCFSMSREIWICLKAASKSKLAPRLAMSLLERVPTLDFSVGSGTKRLLTSSAPSIWLIVPRSGIRFISRSHICCTLLSKLLLFRRSSWTVSPWT